MALNEWFIQGKIEIDFYMGSIVKFVSPFKDFPKNGASIFLEKGQIGGDGGGECPRGGLSQGRTFSRLCFLTSSLT